MSDGYKFAIKKMANNNIKEINELRGILNELEGAMVLCSKNTDSLNGFESLYKLGKDLMAIEEDLKQVFIEADRIAHSNIDEVFQEAPEEKN